MGFLHNPLGWIFTRGICQHKMYKYHTDLSSLWLRHQELVNKGRYMLIYFPSYWQMLWLLLPNDTPWLFWVNYMLKSGSSALVINLLFTMLFFICWRLASFSCDRSLLLIIPFIPSASSSITPALLCLDFFSWNRFSASYFLTFLLPLTHLIRLLEIWYFPWLLWWLLSSYYAFSNPFSGKSFFLISSILGFWGNPSCLHFTFFPFSVTPHMFSNRFSADSSEILLSLPAFPFGLKCRPVALIPFQCLADSSVELKLSS